MRPGNDNRKLLLQYLLGELKPEDAAKLDERLLADASLLDSMEDAQNDLLDAYAAGDLDAEQCKRVERALLRSSRQWERLRLARSLRAQKPSGSALRAAAVSKPRPWSFKIPIFLVAAACTAAIIVGLIDLPEFQRSKNEPENIASGGRPAPAARSKPQTQSGLQLSQGAPRAAPFVLLLGAGVTRGSIRSAKVPRNLDRLEVQIVLGADEAANRYDVVIESSKGQAVASYHDLAPNEIFSHRLLRFQIAARSLPTGVYVFRVYRQGPPESEAAAYRVDLSREAG